MNSSGHLGVILNHGSSFKREARSSKIICFSSYDSYSEQQWRINKSGAFGRRMNCLNPPLFSPSDKTCYLPMLMWANTFKMATYSTGSPDQTPYPLDCWPKWQNFFLSLPILYIFHPLPQKPSTLSLKVPISLNSLFWVCMLGEGGIGHLGVYSVNVHYKIGLRGPATVCWHSLIYIWHTTAH